VAAMSALKVVGFFGYDQPYLSYQNMCGIPIRRSLHRQHRYRSVVADAVAYHVGKQRPHWSANGEIAHTIRRQWRNSSVDIAKTN
jgi:hypothetical protein